MNHAALALPLALAIGLAACNQAPEADPASADSPAADAMAPAEEIPAPVADPAEPPVSAAQTPAATPTPEPAEERPGANAYGGEDEGAPPPPG